MNIYMLFKRTASLSAQSVAERCRRTMTSRKNWVDESCESCFERGKHFLFSFYVVHFPPFDQWTPSPSSPHTIPFDGACNMRFPASSEPPSDIGREMDCSPKPISMLDALPCHWRAEVPMHHLVPLFKIIPLLQEQQNSSRPAETDSFCVVSRALFREIYPLCKKPQHVRRCGLATPPSAPSPS